jgi:hypothetical protein
MAACQRLAACFMGHPIMCFEKGKCPPTCAEQKHYDLSWGGRKDEKVCACGDHFTGEGELCPICADDVDWDPDPARKVA